MTATIEAMSKKLLKLEFVVKKTIASMCCIIHN